MRSLLLQLFLLGCFAHMGSAQATSAQASGKPAPQLDHFDPKKVDTSVDPCTDFYQYSCNRWIADNPVPPDEVFWDSFGKLQLWNESFLHQTVLDGGSKTGQQSALRSRPKVGDTGPRVRIRSREMPTASLHFAASVAADRSHVQQKSDRRSRGRICIARFPALGILPIPRPTRPCLALAAQPELHHDTGRGDRAVRSRRHGDAGETSI